MTDDDMRALAERLANWFGAPPLATAASSAILSLLGKKEDWENECSAWAATCATREAAINEWKATATLAESRLARALEALRAIRRHVDSPAHYDAHIDGLCDAVLTEMERENDTR